MRHSASEGRHSRPPLRVPLSSYLITVLALMAAVLAAAGLAGAFSASPAVAAPAVPDRGTAVQAAPEMSHAEMRARLAQAAVQARMEAAVRAAAQVAATLAAHTYTVHAGDSISAVATRHCGAARDWTGIYAASRVMGWTARNANSLSAGQHLYLSCSYDASQLRFAPAPPPPAPVHAVAAVATARTAGHSYAAPAPASARSYSSSGYGNVSAASYGGYQQCVITRESGGQSQVMNASGHYGLYQFDYGTWVSGGGSGADFGHASVTEQNRVFAAVYAARGTQPWSPSDGC